MHNELIHILITESIFPWEELELDQQYQKEHLSCASRILEVGGMQGPPRWECEAIHLRLKGQVLFFSDTLVKLRAHLASNGRWLGSHLLT